MKLKIPSNFDENQRVAYQEYEERKIKISNKPLAIFVELTQNCNLHCDYCRQKSKYDSALNMPIDLFSRIAEMFFPYTKIVDLRGWGESTILRNFLDYVEITSNYGSQIRLISNGIAGNSEVWEELIKVNTIIGISCDTADAAKFALLRSGASLQKLHSNLRQLVSFRDRYNSPKENLFITSVVSGVNVKSLEDLVYMANELGITKIVFFPISLDPSHPWHLRFFVEDAKIGIQKAFDAAQKTGIHLRLAASLEESLRLKKESNIPCIHPWMYLVVDYQGRLSFCDLLIGNEKYFSGSLNTQNFDDIWNGDYFQELRSAHITNKIPEKFSACRWCYPMRLVDFEELIYQPLQDKIVSSQNHKSFTYDMKPIENVPDFY